MESHTLRKARCPPVFRNPIWKLKYEQDQNKLRNKLQRQLSNDFVRLYEESHLVDLQLKTANKDVLCHSFIIESRYLPLWSLIIQLARFKKEKNNKDSKISISIPTVDFFSLDCFVRSLYTQEINEALWPSLKLQIEACLSAPKLVKKPFVIESLDYREERRLEALIGGQIKEGKFNLKKSNLENFSKLFVDFGGPENVPKGKSEALNPNAKRLGRVNLTQPQKSYSGMTSEQDTIICSSEEVIQKVEDVPPFEEDRPRSQTNCKGTISKNNYSHSSFHRNEDRRSHTSELLSEDAVSAHNAANDCYGVQDTSSLEVELESSNDGQISSPDTNQSGSSKVSDKPITQTLTRTRTFEVITPLKISNVCSTDLYQSAEANGYNPQPDVSRFRKIEQEKDSLVFDKNCQAYSNIPTSNLMTMSSEEDHMSSQRHSRVDKPFKSSFSSLLDDYDRRPMDESGRRSFLKKENWVSQPRDAASPSPDSLCDDDSRLPPKEEYDSEEKERDDSESFQELFTNTDLPANENERLTRSFHGREYNTGPAQVSVNAVRDIDEISIVDRYESALKKAASDESEKGQSIFSMFIDLNQIPSPKKEPKPKKIMKSQSGVYMFIDAGTSSPDVTNPTNKDGIKYNGTDSSQVKVSVRESSFDSKSNKKPIKEMPSREAQNKGFYMFIEADSNSSSPKPRRRFSSQNRLCNKENLMSKSAPTDSHLFKGRRPTSKSITTNNTLKLMTKSVIDRDEFMSQPSTRRNVSLNEKINETSKIPRPVANFRQKIKSRSVIKNKSENETQDDMAFLDELNKKVESEFDDLNRVNGVNISRDVSSVSDVSSLLNCMDRSSNKQNLGDDLLRMFENEINTDLTIQVGERRIRAHKCILSSRCVYFAAMLSGHWVESAGNIIKLEGFSAESVIVALKHIYSGKSVVPPGVKAVELAALSDLLCLDGLKDVVSLHLKANQCHYFHKPCADCLIGVLEVLPIAGAYYLDDLFRRCLKWISKHFTLVLPTRGFATLPLELQEKCIKQIIDEVSVSSAMDIAMGCDRVLCLLPSVKWAHGIIELSSHLFDMVKTFITSNLSSVISSDRFLSMNTDGHWSIEKMDKTLLSCCARMKLDEAISTHIKLSNTLGLMDNEDMKSFSEMFVDMLKRLLGRTEKILMENANRVSVCRKWPLLSAETQRKIKDSSLSLLENKNGVSANPKLSNISRIRGSSIEPLVRARASSMSDSKLTRSASSAVVPNIKPTSVRKLKSTSDRCQTPPAPLMRSILQTPLSNKTSTLRAQAAIQRSQSARCVADRPKKILSSKNCNANIENKHNINRKDGTYSFQSDRSRPSTRCSMLSTNQTEHHGSRPLTPNRQLYHKRNYSGSHLSHLQKNFKLENNSETEVLLGSSVGFNNCNAIPKPSRTHLPVIQGSTGISTSLSHTKYTNSNPQDSDCSYEEAITPVTRSLARSNTFSKD